MDTCKQLKNATLKVSGIVYRVKNGSYPGEEALHMIEEVVEEMDRNVVRLKGTVQRLNNALELTNKMKNSYAKELKELKKEKNMNLCAVCGDDSFDMSTLTEDSETDNSQNLTPSETDNSLNLTPSQQSAPTASQESDQQSNSGSSQNLFN